MDFNQVTTVIGLLIQLLIGLGAVTFAFLQWRINRRLKQLQDYVSLSVYFDDEIKTLNIMNVGKINLYVYKYEFMGRTENIEKGELIPVGVNDKGVYKVRISVNDMIEGKFYTLKLYVSDGGKQKYISEHEVKKDPFTDTHFVINIKNFAPVKSDWKF